MFTAALLNCDFVRLSTEIDNKIDFAWLNQTVTYASMSSERNEASAGSLSRVGA